MVVFMFVFRILLSFVLVVLNACKNALFECTVNSEVL